MILNNAHRFLLLRARETLTSGQHLFLCSAIEDAAFHWSPVCTQGERLSAMRELHEHIEGSLQGFASLHGYAQHYFGIDDMPDLHTLRMDWAQWLSQQYEMPVTSSSFLHQHLRALYWARRRTKLRLFEQRLRARIASIFGEKA